MRTVRHRRRSVRCRRPERWLPIPGWECLYEVSDLCRARSVDRSVTDSIGRRQWFRGRILTAKTEPKMGYLVITLCRGKQNQVTVMLHRVMLEAHCGPCPEGMQACHGPLGTAWNSYPESGIHWGTPAENSGPDKVRDGTDSRGERMGAHKLTEIQVREILARHAAEEIRTRENPRGKPQGEVAAEYGVSREAISQILTGRHWSWL